MRDYYYILGIPPDATEADIKAAFRKLSHRFHPDKNNGRRFFEERFKSILEAYAVLSDAGKRKAYDEKLRHYRSSGMNAADLRRLEVALERMFEEEYKKREQAIRDAYTMGERPIHATAAQKTIPGEAIPAPATGEKPRPGKKLLIAALAVAIIILAVLLFTRKHPADARATPPPPSTGQKPGG
ncbi:J domain-containing protein [Chitinophaga lutea]|uniref:J domain-containing protein n=1 Tax=Chitinophaga lutea TaxID=2488634 RepID=A0A3N4PB96_9BACT|nr:J domain-containing protein [Chitinophaga lutea]RPE05942.1 J domain-containing protein [Chitinophaga lutea]